MSARRFPPPWTAEELDACFVMTDSARARCDRLSVWRPQTPKADHKL